MPCAVTGETARVLCKISFFLQTPTQILRSSPTFVPVNKRRRVRVGYYSKVMVSEQCLHSLSKHFVMMLSFCWNNLTFYIQVFSRRTRGLTTRPQLGHIRVPLKHLRTCTSWRPYLRVVVLYPICYMRSARGSVSIRTCKSLGREKHDVGEN